ncbi:MAG: HAMP domain-containing histidine kinase [Syntrophomonadaceae bacterium]|nr:HAMP domain-containing histidine kinase [Syntrophomonadaceae bacterium]
MKLRTYFMTLLLFLLFFNSSILLISSVNLKSNVDSIRERCLGEHYFIVTAYAQDLKAVESRGTTAERTMEPLFQSYVSYYGKKKVFLAISREGQPLYSSMPVEEAFSGQEEKPAAGYRVLSTVKSKGREYITVTGTLPPPYAAYTLTYLCDISENIASWNRVTGILYTVGIAFSFLLAVCLILLLNHIFKPLQQISLASQNIARGDYDNRIPVTGQDELAEMAQSFNHMAEEIQNQMVLLAKSAEQKQCFIDNFAHELRTPLTTIYGYAEYIQKAAITEDERLSAASYIMSESRRLQNMAYRLLDLAMLRNDEVTFTEVKVPELFHRTAEELQQKAAEKQVQLEYDCQLDSLTGDCELLKCLLVNLADNGLKACTAGGKVKLDAGYEDHKKVVTVQDNGRGMTEEQMSHITEAFYRVDKSRSSAEGGVGLGLSLCEQIAVRHGAEILFSSRPDQGTTVKITFTTF